MVPAWILSLVLHVGLVLLLAVSIRGSTGGVAEEADRTTGIVLKRVEPVGEFYEGEEDAAEQAATV